MTTAWRGRSATARARGSWCVDRSASPWFCILEASRSRHDPVPVHSPGAQESSRLPGLPIRCVARPTGEEKVTRLRYHRFNPILQGMSRSSRDLEPHWALILMLHDDSARPTDHHGTYRGIGRSACNAHLSFGLNVPSDERSLPCSRARDGRELDSEARPGVRRRMPPKTLGSHPYRAQPHESYFTRYHPGPPLGERCGARQDRGWRILVLRRDDWHLLPAVMSLAPGQSKECEAAREPGRGLGGWFQGLPPLQPGRYFH